MRAMEIPPKIVKTAFRKPFCGIEIISKSGGFPIPENRFAGVQKTESRPFGGRDCGYGRPLPSDFSSVFLEAPFGTEGVHLAIRVLGLVDDVAGAVDDTGVTVGTVGER
jgi:hypothetical protein